jgi:hypothetical protein
MRVGRGHLVTRVLGVCLGVGFLALGLFAVTGGTGAGEGGRALGLGVALIVVGTAAAVGSITVADPTRIW